MIFPFDIQYSSRTISNNAELKANEEKTMICIDFFNSHPDLTDDQEMQVYSLRLNKSISPIELKRRLDDLF